MRGGNSNNFIGITSNVNLPPIQTRILKGVAVVNKSRKSVSPRTSTTNIVVPSEIINVKNKINLSGRLTPTKVRRPHGGKRKTRRRHKKARN